MSNRTERTTTDRAAAARTPRPAPIAVLLLAAAPLSAGEVVPTDGMVITENTTFVPGSYALPNGVSFGASGVTLDMNGAELVGTGFANYGVTSIGHDDVTIENGTVRNYYYGLRIQDGAGVIVRDNDLSLNWVDPASQGGSAPFLDINVGPVLGDTTNLGGGLFMKDVASATITGNTSTGQQHGMNLYFVTESTVSGNVVSDNTGWGIHLHGSTENVISENTADRCIRTPLGDSAGMLLVMGSHANQVLNNSFRQCGDGFFIGNENGCPSNGNLVVGNDGSSAGANAFEATFSSGNRFVGNTADASNYGFWLGYSHSGNKIISNSIRANNASGIEIEHGQGNVISGNTISGNGGAAIVLRTDGVAHFPPASFPCLELPNQEASSHYEIRDNVITSNFGVGLQLIDTTDSTIVNNLVAGNGGGTAVSNGAGNTWSIVPEPGENIVGGPTLGGNYWDDYAGADNDADGLGDTDVPYTSGGAIAPPGDPHPLVGDPDVGEFDNPRSLCSRRWTDLGRNTREAGQVFDTANGAHFATDGEELLLLEGTNSNRLDRFDFGTSRYVARAGLPESVWDGGGFQYGGSSYFATVGVQFNAADGSGKGAKLYSYDPGGDAWTSESDSRVGFDVVANESIAYDPVHDRCYATIVAAVTGAAPNLRQKLAIYEVASGNWTGATTSSGVEWSAGSEAEYLGGRIYVWPGGFGGGAVNGADSFLHVYDIATGAWSTTPSLQDSGVIPGFRSGAFDIWGVTITSDPVRGLLFVQGGEANRLIYVFDVAAQTWTVAPTAVYDGGWGDGLEYVTLARSLFQIDGRDAQGGPQGTAVLAPSYGNVDGDDDGAVTFDDLLIVLSTWGPCPDPCCPADLDEDGEVGFGDLLIVLSNWT